MSSTLSALLLRNLHDVFEKIDPASIARDGRVAAVYLCFDALP